MEKASTEKTLLELALYNEWSSALERALSHPKEIYHQRPFDGLNVLHMAAGSRATVDVFERLHEIHPGYFERAACSVDARGMAPLLVACAHRASLSVLQFLFQTTPKSAIAQADKDGWSALSFLACWPLASWRTSDHNTEAGGGNLSLQESFLPLATTLLNVDPDIATRPNKVGYSPLHLLVSTHQVELQFFYHYFSSTVTTNNAADLLMVPRERQSSLHDLWQVIQLFVASGNGANDDSKSTILHQCLAIPSCPVLLVMLSCRMHPEHLLQGDSDGNTPLHLAVRHKQTFLIAYLLNVQPDAAHKVNQFGETPFCISTQQSYTDQWHSKVHAPLLQAHPPVLHKANIHPSTYPKIMERILKNEIKKISERHALSHLAKAALHEHRCSHTTVYQMIRSAPFLSSSS